MSITGNESSVKDAVKGLKKLEELLKIGIFQGHQARDVVAALAYVGGMIKAVEEQVSKNEQG